MLKGKFHRSIRIFFRRAAICGLFPLVLTLTPTVIQANDSQTAQDLTTLLRAARAVTVNKKTIADPSQLNVKKFVKKTKKNYLRSSGKKLDESDVMLGQLMEAIKVVVTNAKAGTYDDKWTEGEYAHKFLPARFARETGIEFGKITQGKGVIKLTTSNGLLVNPDNKADAWEHSAIENKFLSANWERNKVFAESTPNGYRLMLPEYYGSGCIACHGGAAGKRIHPAKISGELGDFGGAISITLK